MSVSKKHCLGPQPKFDHRGRRTAALCRRAAAIAGKLNLTWSPDWKTLQAARVELGHRRRISTRSELRHGFPAFLAALFWHVRLSDSVVLASLTRLADCAGITESRASRYLSHAGQAGWVDVSTHYDVASKLRLNTISLTPHAWAAVGLSAEASKEQHARNSQLSDRQERQALGQRAFERRLRLLASEFAAKKERRIERRATVGVAAVVATASRSASVSTKSAQARNARVIELLAAGVDQREAIRMVNIEIPI